MIEINDLSKYYGRNKALDNISFNVEKGEIVGLLGPNGAGKTTTMRILTCYLPATSGTAKICGYDIFEDSMKVKSIIGYLPENPPLYEDMSVYTYLDFVARIKEVDSADRKPRIEEIMDTVNIATVSKRVIGHLSKGYKQRVALAQCLLNNPEVLILDEPTVGLDPKQILEIRELIKRLQEKHTVILSSHILSEVSMICERVVIINKGKIVAIDTQDDLAKRVQTREEIYVQIKGPKENVIKVLNERLTGLKKMDLVREENGVNGFRIESELGLDLREPMFKLIAENNWIIMELKPIKVSLEEVFLQLTQEEGIEK